MIMCYQHEGSEEEVDAKMTEGQIQRCGRQSRSQIRKHELNSVIPIYVHYICEWVIITRMSDK